MHSRMTLLGAEWFSSEGAMALVLGIRGSTTPQPTWPSEVCTNGADDDADSLTDCDDPDCSFDPTCTPGELCDTGMDEDGDGLVDCADPNCGGAVCGIGLRCVAGACQ